MVFDAYARYYDLVYRDKNYGDEAEYVASHIRGRAPRAKRILELGCGTGAHAEHLARMGYEVDGVDLSDAMLRKAEQRSKTLSTKVSSKLSFRQGDVRSVRLGETYDVVISLFHVMSYQTTNSDLEATLETAALHLAPGGLFLYDFWYGPAVLAQKPETRVKRLSDDDVCVTRIAEPVLYANDNCVDVNYTVLVERKASGELHKFTETHRMRYYFLPELEHYQKHVFEKHQAFSWMTGEPLSENSWSGFLVTRKR